MTSLHPKKCCICGNKTPAYTLFSFPSLKYKDIFDQWVMAVGERISHLQPDDIRKKCRVCESHFAKTDLYVSKVNNRWYLKKNIVPRIDVPGILVKTQTLPCTPHHKRAEKELSTPQSHTPTSNVVVAETNITPRSPCTPHYECSMQPSFTPTSCPKRKLLTLDEDFAKFEKEVNIQANIPCDICTKLCYSKLLQKFSASKPPYLPPELQEKSVLLICTRCYNHISSSSNLQYPPKAYWNKLDPGEIPAELECLTQPEIRLLMRIIPFFKIIKLSGFYGQYSFKGQAILFAMDIFEVTQKLQCTLPRSTNDTSMVVFTENLENLNLTKAYTISCESVCTALHWLMKNNPLYKDVSINNDVRMDQNDIICMQRDEEETVETEISIPQEESFRSIGPHSKILRASWNQANKDIFKDDYAGIQCCAMALANILRACIIPPNEWKMNILDENLISGHELYRTIRTISYMNTNAFPIPETGYLCIRNFDVIRHSISMFSKTFSMHYSNEPTIFGSLQDEQNIETNFGCTLLTGLQTLFEEHNAGILIASSYAYSVMHIGEKYYFTDSHSCGPNGEKAMIGQACAIECETILELHRIVKQATGSNNVQFTLDFIDAQVNLLNESIEVHQKENDPPELSNTIASESHPDNDDFTILEARNTSVNDNDGIQAEEFCLPIQTSLMTPIDAVQPEEEDELEIDTEADKIRRKSTDNVVNLSHKLKAEEYAWYQLFPYGKNGLHEQRLVKISPLDYFQFRILGKDTRFQKNDYLFYALSMFEYYCVKSTIAASGKKIRRKDGTIDDVHLYLKNLRGTSTYWRATMNELLAHIKCLGIPHYFLTFSSNDLHWSDMKKALLVADNQPNVDPEELTTAQTQRLIELYPVVVSRHFMHRVAALMRYLKKNCKNILGGALKDYLWRIEFQNQGSPHLHMVAWLEDQPQFDTPEGLQKIDEACCCSIPEKSDTVMNELVQKFQIHHHTMTCKKNSTTNCRFGFPRQVNNETRIITYTSDEFLQTGGCIYILKRKKGDEWVNNYNPTLLMLWKGNMDIQPCGSNDAIAHYIGKYVSKSEPDQLDSNLARAIAQVRQEQGDTFKKLFKICMNTLNQRQISACECVFCLAHLTMRHSSRHCIFINTRKPEERYRLMKFDQSGNACGFYDNIIDHYQKRPLHHKTYDFETMPLLEFAMLFESIYPSKRQSNIIEEEEENFDDLELPDDGEVEPAPSMHLRSKRRLITLQNGRKMKVQALPAVVHTPYFKVNENPEVFYYSLLLQFYPFRSEEELLIGFNSAKEAFLAREEELKASGSQMGIYLQRDKLLETAYNQVHASDILETFGLPKELTNDNHLKI